MSIHTRIQQSYKKPSYKISNRYYSKPVYTHTLPGRASARKVKPIWILLKQGTVSGSSISWVICKPAPCSRQITMPAPHHSVFYRPDAIPNAQPTVSKHWRQSKPVSEYNKKLSYRRGTVRCVVSTEILPIATQQCRNYLYDKSWTNRWYEVGDLAGGNAW